MRWRPPGSDATFGASRPAEGSAYGTAAPLDDLKALRHLSLKIHRQIALKVTRYDRSIGSHPRMVLLILTSIRTRDPTRQGRRELTTCPLSFDLGQFSSI
jgi:hypothetical protein